MDSRIFPGVGPGVFCPGPSLVRVVHPGRAIMHSLILGITDTGKTTLAFKLAKIYKGRGTPVIVLDPDIRKEWQADYITDDPDAYLAVCKVNQGAALFIDESGQTVGRYSGAMSWLATNSRKWGHKAHFISQRATQLDILMRTQCSNLFLFKQSVNDSKILAAEFVCPGLMGACYLKKGEYLAKLGVDKELKRGRAW